jgi:hypothetical protein
LDSAHAIGLLQVISSGDDDECILWERYARLGLMLRGETPHRAITSSTRQLEVLPRELSFVYEHHSDYLVFAIGTAHSEL